MRARTLTAPPPPTSQLIPGDYSNRVDEPNTTLSLQWWGKAPPIDPFGAEGLDEHWDDWLPTFERAAEWNDWSDSECLLQLAGHLKGKARQEFSLLTSGQMSTFTMAKTALRSRLEIGSKTLAPQEFRHAHRKQCQTIY